MYKSNIYYMSDFVSAPEAKVKNASQAAMPTAAAYGQPKPHEKLGVLVETIFSIRDDDEIGNVVADSTVMYAIEALINLPNDVPAPDIDFDEDGVIEFEWENEGRSFSVYITDTRKTAFAGYFSENEVFSGYQDVRNVLKGDDLLHISNVYAGAPEKWIELRR